MPRKCSPKPAFLCEINAMGVIINKFRLDQNGSLLIPNFAKNATTKRRRRGDHVTESNEEVSDSLDFGLKAFPETKSEIEQQIQMPLVTIEYKAPIYVPQIIQTPISYPPFDDIKSFFDKTSTKILYNDDMDVPNITNQHNFSFDF